MPAQLRSAGVEPAIVVGDPRRRGGRLPRVRLRRGCRPGARQSTADGGPRRRGSGERGAHLMAQSTILVLLGALWLCFLVLAAVVWAMLRQIGVLYERVAPVGALMDSGGPKVGEASPTMRLPSLNGGGVVVGPGRGRAQLLFFLSTSCPVCKQLLPVLDSVRKDEGHWLDVVLASDGEEANHQAFN